ncbi:MAG: penicillin-binding protein activator [Myxococcales bacterium]|nr:penicillin-binding protein activator [Myxococcales bacterium]
MSPAMSRPLLAVLALALSACPRPSTGTGPGNVPRIEAKVNPDADKALAAAINVADTKGRKAGIEALLLVRKTYPESTAGQDALYRAGVLAFEEGDYVQARKSLNELVFENPLHAKADDARLKAGLAAVELKAWRDAYQTLSSLVERLQGEDRRLAEEGLARASAATQQFSEALRLALKKVDAAATPEETKTALDELEVVVETRTDFRSIAEAWEGLSASNPAWPLLTFKLARVYYHLRDLPRLEERLDALIEKAPASPWTKEAQALKARVSRRAAVRPRAIGALLPLSGKYENFGKAALRGLQLAMKGSEVELVVKDSQGDPALTGKLVEELALDEGVIAIVGPLLTDDARRAALVAEELQVPLLTMSRAPQVTDIGPYVFRTMVTNSQQAQALAEYAVGTLGFKSFAVLYPNTPFGVELTNEFWDAIQKRGGEIRGVESYDHDQKTFTEEAQKLVGRYYLEDRYDYIEQLREIREKETDEFRRRKAIDKMRARLEPVIDFEALLIPDSWQQVSLVSPALAVEDIITNACDKKDLERIQKTTGKTKLKTVTLLGPSTWSSPRGSSGEPMLIERGGKYVLCSVFVDTFFEGSDRQGTKSFVKAFREAHRDATITLLDVVGYDTGAIVRNVVEKAQPSSRPVFREKLSLLKGFEGATTTISFDDHREARRDLFFLNITPRGIKEVPLAPPKPEG